MKQGRLRYRVVLPLIVPCEIEATLRPTPLATKVAIWLPCRVRHREEELPSPAPLAD